MVNTHALLYNPRELIRWQSDKVGYMSQLAQFVKVPQTLIIRHYHEDYPGFEEAAEILGCDELVIKPAHGNAGIGVYRFNSTEESIEEYEEKMEEYLWGYHEDMLIQCFMYSIDHNGPGEINIYMVDGQVTHAGYAIPAKDGYLIHEEYGGDGGDHTPGQLEIDYATRLFNAAVQITGVRPLYFRVDLMYDNDGELTLMELACGTTDMSFREYPHGARMMAEALDRRLKEHEARYEQAHGKKPELIDQETYDELNGKTGVDHDYETFGTPLRGGEWGKKGLWKQMAPKDDENEAPAATPLSTEEVHEEL